MESMNKSNITLVIFLASVALIGCQTGSSPSSDEIPQSGTTESAQNPEIKSGLYSEGPEYDHLSKLLSESTCRIRLDIHSGITLNTDQEIEDINELTPLLKSIDSKNTLVISTGKAMWDKKAGYIDEIVVLANQFGYKMTIVIDDHSSGIFVRRSYIHR